MKGKNIVYILSLLLFFVAEAYSQRPVQGEKQITSAQRLYSAGEQAKCLVMTNHIIDSYRGINDKSHSDSVVLMKAEYLCGQANISLGNSVRGLSLLKSAANYAKCLGDTKFMAKIYNSLFYVYYNALDFTQALDLLNVAIDLSQAERDTYNLVRLYNNRGLVFYARRNYDEALKNMYRALNYTSAGDKLERSQIYTNMAEVYYVQKRYVDTEHRLALALDELKGKDITGNTIQTYLNMALVKAQLGKYSATKELENRLYGVLPRLALPAKVNSIRQLAEIDFVIGDSIRGLHNMLEYDQLADSLQKQDNNSQMRQLLVAYDTERLAQHNETLRQSLRTKNIVVYGSVVFMIVVGGFAVLLWLKAREDKRKSMLIAEQKELLLRYEKTEHERRQKEMALELEHKSRQLTSYTIDLAAVNEFHQKISSELDNVWHNVESIGDNADKAKEIKKCINNIKGMVSHFNDKPVNDDFRIFFEEVHPDFLKKLSKTYPKLSETDLRLCAYLLLGMSTKEIAALTCREVRSIESSRFRLRKKLGLEPGADVKAFLESQSKRFNTVQ